MSSLLKFFTFIVTVVTVTSNSINTNRDSSVIDKFKNWVDLYQIQSINDHHLAHIFDNWLSNDKFIWESNYQNLTWTLGHNAYSGFNSEEFSKLMGFKANSELFAQKGGTEFLRGSISTVKQENILNLDALPVSIDWRSKGVVNNIRDQSQCGSCWAFSGTSTVESAVAIKTGHLYDLSEQQSVSCAGLKYGNLGCNGGMYDGLWDFAKNNGGLCSENDYPYTSGNGDTGTCIKTCDPISGTKIISYVDVTPYSDSAMMTALTIEPVSIAIEADTKSFQLYKSGVYSDYAGCNANSKNGASSDAQPNIDHAVVLVGYGSDSGQDYYILRNSWASSWGESGYMRISRGPQYGKYGVCGVLYDPMYPVV